MRDLLYFGAWVFLLPLSFTAANIAVLLWIWVAIIPPGDMLYGTLGIVPQFNKIVAAAAFFSLIVAKAKRDFYRDVIGVFIVLFTIQVTLSYFAADYSSVIADVQYDKFWKEIVLFFLITGLMYTRHRLHMMVLVAGISLGFLMVKEALIFLLTVGGHQVQGLGSIGDNNGVAMALLMVIPLLLYCARYTQESWVRLGIYCTVVLGIITVIATYSRGGFIGLLAMGVMLLKNSKYKFRALVALGIVAVAAIALVPQDYVARLSTIRDASQDGSFEIRLLAWKINYLLALDHPFLGTGPYGSLIPQNWFAKVGEAATWLFPSPLVLRSFAAHSVYFQVLGDTGFIGLFLFLGILISALFTTMATQRLAKRNKGLEWSGELARALQISIVVYMVTGAALSLLYFELLFILVAVISRNHHTARQLVTAKQTQVDPWLRGRQAAVAASAA